MSGGLNGSRCCLLLIALAAAIYSENIANGATPIETEAKNRFAQKLKIVEQYEKNIPEDTIGTQKTTASVKPYKGVPSLYINDQPVFPMAMVPIGHFPQDVCRDFAAAGVHIYSHIIWAWESSFMTKDVDWWLGPGKYDFTKIDRQILSIIEADPQAYIVLRVKITPPAWWVKAHPNELSYFEDGKPASQHSMASKVWEEAYERMLRDLIRHVEGSRYVGHIIGYHPAGGSASEWFWWGSDIGPIDYGPAARNRFREWLKKQYGGDIDRFQKAWNDSQVTFETAVAPNTKERESSEYMIFRNPSKARRVMDFQRFLRDITTYHILKSCRICKEETGGKKIVGVFYGYSMWLCLNKYGFGPWNCGRLGLKTVLESPDVDFLCSPTDYDFRKGGTPGNFISAYSASYKLHNKFYWDEADHRTHLSSSKEPACLLTSLSETLSVFGRGFGYMLTKGTGLWWFTLMGDDTFHQDEIMEDIARMQKAGENTLADGKERIHEVAVLVDEESYTYLRNAPGELHRPLIRGMQLNLATMGAPYDTYLLSDIANAKMPDYKLYIFLNPFCVSDSLRDAIKKKVRRNNAVSAWFYAPGFIQEDGTFSENAIQDMVGIRVRHKLEKWQPRLTIANVDHPMTSRVKSGDQTSPMIASSTEFGPKFWVDDPKADVLGRLGQDGPALLAAKDFGTWRSVYCAAPWLSTDLLRGLIRYAGGHVYSESDDTFDANRSFIMIHTAKAGKKHIALPQPCNVYDVLQAKTIGRNLKSFDLDLHQGVTCIFQLRDTRTVTTGEAIHEHD